MLLIEDRLEAARSHLDAGRADSAALLYESVLDLSPSNVTALRQLASIKLKAGETRKAHELAGAAAARAAGDADVLSLFAKTALVCEQVDQAAAALDQALAIEPLHAEAARLKAGLLARQANLREAERLLQAASEKYGDAPELPAVLSEIYMEHGLAAPALELSQRALELAPDRPELLALLGTQLAELGDHARAIGFLEQAHLKDPGNALSLVRLADTQAATGELAAAYRTARRAIGLFPDLLPAWTSYARVMIYRGEAQAGLAAFVPVARRHPDKAAALLALAATFRIAGDPGQALRLVEPLARQPKSMKPTELRHLMALLRDCLLSLGMFEQVAATFPGFDPRAALGLPEAEAGTMATDGAQSADLPPDADLAAALADAGLVIDGSLSTLEAIALLRFVPKDRPAAIHGPARLAEIVTLMENVRFAPNDLPSGEAPAGGGRQFPLSHMLALPASLRGGIAERLPYMGAPEERRAIWRRSLAGLPRPLVALAWDGSRPGLLLEDYRPVLKDVRGTLVSVMWDDGRRQLASWPQVIDAGVHFASLADLAAVIAETDAVIGPDGIPLHLAGAMGRPGALLGQPSTPWYWHDDGGRSVWYPSIAVMRSRAFGNWEEKLPDLGERIAGFLADPAGSGRTTAPALRPPEHQAGGSD